MIPSSFMGSTNASQWNFCSPILMSMVAIPSTSISKNADMPVNGCLPIRIMECSYEGWTDVRPDGLLVFRLWRSAPSSPHVGGNCWQSGRVHIGRLWVCTTLLLGLWRMGLGLRFGWHGHREFFCRVYAFPQTYQVFHGRPRLL